MHLKESAYNFIYDDLGKFMMTWAKIRLYFTTHALVHWQ